MKTMKHIMLMLVLFLSINFVSAQNGATTINGVKFDQQYTKAQIESLWGVPTQFKHDVGGECEVYDYLYGKDNLGFDGQFTIAYFDLKSDKFKINGVVGVGDNISKFSSLPNRMESKSYPNYVVYVYSVFNLSNSIRMLFYVKNNIIYRMTYDALY